MIPGHNDIVELIDMVWSSTVGLHIEPLDDAGRAEWALPAVEAQVHIAGMWQGAVVLNTSQRLAAQVAQRMFSLDIAEPTSDDIQDAFGEIANITGGNVKGMLSEGDAHLSLPVVIQGRDYSVRVPRSREVLRVEFICEGHPMVVTLLQAEVAEGTDAVAGVVARRAELARKF
jgi:chemotaxis protein CheX